MERKMASKMAMEIAARAWCTPETENRIMDVALANAFADILDKYIEALIWCEGSFDFSPEGQAFEGFNKIRKELLSDD